MGVGRTTMDILREHRYSAAVLFLENSTPCFPICATSSSKRADSNIYLISSFTGRLLLVGGCVQTTQAVGRLFSSLSLFIIMSRREICRTTKRCTLLRESCYTNIRVCICIYISVRSIFNTLCRLSSLVLPLKECPHAMRYQDSEGCC